MSNDPVKTYRLKMKNPLQSPKFNRHSATKDRSPGFRAVVILLVLFFSFLIIYAMARRNGIYEQNNDIRHALEIEK
jgi:hypothetical protein